jgi:type I restriction enzyme S subunit
MRQPGPYPVFGSNGRVGFHVEPLVNGPGIIIGRKGTVGAVHFSKEPFWPIDTTFYVTEAEHRDLRFTYYLLCSLGLDRMNADSAVPGLNRNAAHARRILVPPLPEQRAIARILGTLDDKIELNRRMNETLEAMAQALFKSWFVDFDPVVVNAIKAGNPIPEKFAARAAHYRDNPDALGLPEDILRLFPARFVDSELGPIPEGWEVKHLADAIEIHDSKRIPLNSRERAARQGPYPYYGATGVMDYVDDYLFDGIYVLVGEDGSVIDEKGHPVTQYVWGQFWVNNHAHVLTGDGISNEHLYLILRNTNIRAFVTGAVQPKISQKNLKVIPFVHSGENISRVFASQIAEYYRKIRSTNEESRTLADLRDTLLSKLISGELRVPDVEKILEDTL